MSETKHTSGPWRIRTRGNVGNLIEAQTDIRSFDGDDGYRTIATFQAPERVGMKYDDLEAERLANGRLIARAPEMEAEIAALRSKLARAEEAIKWALGEGDEWPPRPVGVGRYWWRAELRRRAYFAGKEPADGER